MAKKKRRGNQKSVFIQPLSPYHTVTHRRGSYAVILFLSSKMLF